MLNALPTTVRTQRGFLATGRTTAGELYFGLCMAAMALSFLAFYALFKYKLVLFGWLFCIALGVTFWAGRALRLHLSARALLPLAAFHGWLWLTVLWSYDPRESLWWVAVDSLLPVLFLVAVSWAQNVTAWRLSWYFELTASLYALLSLWFLATTGAFLDARFGAVRTGMAATFLAALPFLVWRLRYRPSPYRVVLTGWVVLLLVTLGSRAALALLPLALVGSAVVASRTSRRPLSTAYVATLAGALLAAGLLITPAVRQGIGSGLARFSPEYQALDVSARVVTELQEAGAVDVDRRLQAFVALQTFVAHPWLGDGYMNTYAKTRDRFQREVSAHGLPFTLLGETGLIGTALFLVLIGGFYQAVRRAARTATESRDEGFHLTMMLTMSVLLLFGVFHQVHQSPTLYILLGWGYALAMSARPRGASAYHGPAAGGVPALSP